MKSKQLEFDFMNMGLPLEKAIQEYFDSRVYQGFVQSFQLDRTVKSGTSDALHIRLKGDYEEMIGIRDKKWEEDLLDLGENYGIRLILPYTMYRK